VVVKGFGFHVMAHLGQVRPLSFLRGDTLSTCIIGDGAGQWVAGANFGGLAPKEIFKSFDIVTYRLSLTVLCRSAGTDVIASDHGCFLDCSIRVSRSFTFKEERGVCKPMPYNTGNW